MPNDSYWDTGSPLAEWSTQPRRGLRVTAFLFVALLMCVLGAVLVPGGLGTLVGYQQLQAQNHEAAIIHFNRGLGYLAEDYPELAQTEFEIALQYDATYEPAREKLNALQLPDASGTPGAPSQDRVAAALFDGAVSLVAQKEWGDAITRLEQLRTLNADYRQAEVSDLLYQAYVNSGQAAVASGQIEIARERFESALAIRNGDAEVKRQRDLAVLYLEGQQAFGYNWQTATQKFATLYQQDPNYYDVKERLVESYTQYGDLAAKQNSPCLAMREYDSALALNSDPILVQKRAQAMTFCKQAIAATPTPAAPTGAENFTWKTSTATDKPCTSTGDLNGWVRDALGRGVPNVVVGYYADGIPLVSGRTNANGQYQFILLGKDPGEFHVIILGTDGKTPISLSADVKYPGGNVAGCHIVIEWQRVQ